MTTDMPPPRIVMAIVLKAGRPLSHRLARAHPLPLTQQFSANDGKLQWAKNGAPLCFWVGGNQPGETNGDCVGGVRHIAH